MFFPRLRRHAKWMFVLLAVVLRASASSCSASAPAGSGSATSSAGRAGPTQSVSDAQDETEKNPTDPQAWRDLATAHETEGEIAEAIAALDTAVQLDPKDPTTFRQLAGLRLALATRRQQDAQLLQAVAVYRAPSQLFPGFLGTGGQPVVQDQIANAVAGSVSERVTVGAPGRGHERGAGGRRPTSGSSPSSRTTRTSSSSSRRRPSRPATRRPRSPHTSAS